MAVETQFEDRLVRMPRILWVDPSVRIDDNQILALEIKAAGIDGVIGGPVQEATADQKRWSIYGKGCYAYYKQNRRKTELWLDIPEDGDLMAAHPFLAGMLAEIDWKKLPIVSGPAGEQQYYLNSGRTPIWELLMSCVNRSMLEMLRHTCNPDDLEELMNGARIGVANGKVNGSLTSSLALV